MSLSKIIKETAAKYAVEDVYIAAIILQESSINQYAFRFEPSFFHKYIEKKSKEELGGYWPTSENFFGEVLERTLRACSFGYMQVMLQVAREFGFALNAEELWCDNINIEYGTRKFSRCIVLAKKASNKLKGVELIRAALLKYNGGGDPNYPYLVLRYVENGKAMQLLDT